MNCAPSDQVDFLRRAALEKRTSSPRATVLRKRRREDEAHHWWTVQRLNEEDDEEGPPGDEDDYDPSKYLALPTEEERKECYRKFYKATSSATLAAGICGICARECRAMDESLQKMSLDDIPNSHRLVPRVLHPAHDLYSNRLLQPEAVEVDGPRTIVSVCLACLDELRKPGDKPPQYSLANRLWIGRILWQLQVLTFPEQLLIAHLYPRVFVFKLFPKRQGSVRQASGLQNAMRGNVSTYDMPMDGISTMIQGNLMPRRPAVLASLITVTFIGLGDLPKAWIHSTFRVRRKVVHDALLWLKENNPYYAEIDISASHLEELPEDDVPEEVMDIICQSDDVGMIEQESAGYVPQDNDEGS